MKAVMYKEYGAPDVLHISEAVKPAPGTNQVLVRVHAASVNAADLDLLRGGFMIRPGGLVRPKYPILGSDIAGTVEAVGDNVTEFKPGDEVFGDLTMWEFGGFAEYVSVHEDALVPKPSNCSFEAAAAAPSAGGVALLNLEAKRKIEPGDHVLINGAGGGMGSFAMQMAKASGALVTGVDKGEKMEFMQSIGADRVIDYEKENYTRSGNRYDVILDLAARRSIFSYKRALCPHGAFVLVGGSLTATLQAVFLGPWITLIGNKKMGIVMTYPKKAQLFRLKSLLESGIVRSVIDKFYSLDQTADAVRYLESGHARGKVVIKVA
jgi:NADPH:quinone reductase-like Zn-dependent oxidoreductase